MRMAPRVCRVENSSIHGKSSRRFIRNEIADYLSGFGGIASDRSPRVGGEAYFMEWTAAGPVDSSATLWGVTLTGLRSPKTGEQQTMRVTNAGQTSVRGERN